MGMAELRPKQDCITRWNSTYDMLKSFLQCKDAIISTLAITNASVSPLSQEEWSILQEVCTILEPFQEVTVEISAESYVTASKVILLAKGLQRVTANYQRSVTVTQQASDLVNSLCANMAGRFHRMEYNHTLGDAAVLDPRFKKVAFGDATAADEAFQRIATAAGRVTLSSSEPSQQPGQQEGAGSAAQGSVVWSHFYDRVAGAVSTRNPTADAIMEVRSYLEEPLLPKSSDPLKWWESRATVYPRLSKLMAERLCIVATSVPSERIFSKTGQIVSERRNRIKPSKVRELAFLNANLP
ncbi:hypothetical protein SKAU_G00415570 [Synaphobranchus kaupii]|uniref:HAT C-terminal dimerisation domain-containing protein n=1 Tax=Synaphobranchus kaupii TaxID=118154 RepID=A0A9Q1E7C1_SYNKA|nr:hypothetical protein SKAU_G00415570 [Synaphobranchus kaupii]